MRNTSFIKALTRLLLSGLLLSVIAVSNEVRSERYIANEYKVHAMVDAT